MKYAGTLFGMWALFAGSFQKQLTATPTRGTWSFTNTRTAAATRDALPNIRFLLFLHRIITHNKKANDTVKIFSLLSYMTVTVFPFTEDIPLEVIAFLDPTISGWP